MLVDTYEMFRIADPWLRHELVPSLSTELRFVIAGRDAPMLEWSTERGRVGGLEILPLVGLTDEAAHAFLADARVELIVRGGFGEVYFATSDAGKRRRRANSLCEPWRHDAFADRLGRILRG